MNIDNLVTREVNTPEFHATWKVVDIRRPIPRLFKNDEVVYINRRWLVYDIRKGSKQLVLRPI